MDLELGILESGLDQGGSVLIDWVEARVQIPGLDHLGAGTLTMTVKSAHIYQTELDLMRRLIAAT